MLDLVDLVVLYMLTLRHQELHRWIPNLMDQYKARQELFLLVYIDEVHFLQQDLFENQSNDED
jgi:hypothetical protein